VRLTVDRLELLRVERIPVRVVRFVADLIFEAVRLLEDLVRVVFASAVPTAGITNVKLSNTAQTRSVLANRDRCIGTTLRGDPRSCIGIVSKNLYQAST
jgi:hypothetical protein